MKEEELLNQLELASEEYQERFDTMPFDLSFQEFQEYLNEASEKVGKLSRQYRLIKTPTYSECDPTIGDVMSIEHFLSNVECGGFIDYDGFGNYMKDGKESDIEIRPSDVKNDCVRKDFDTIIWYNR